MKSVRTIIYPNITTTKVTPYMNKYYFCFDNISNTILDIFYIVEEQLVEECLSANA